MRIKNKIIFLAALIVLLIAAIITLSYFSIKNNNEQALENIQPVQIINIKTAVKGFAVTNNDGVYNVIYADGVWFSPENPNAFLNSEHINSLVTTLSTLNAIPVETNAADFSKYGLDKSNTKFEFTDENGSTYKLNFGDKAPTGDGYYLYVNDTKDVYMLSMEQYNLLCGGLDTLRNNKLLSIKVEDLYSISITNAKTSFTIGPKMVNDPNAHSSSQWEMSTPYLKEVNKYIFETNILKKLDFTIYDFVDDNPSDYSKYGLDNPKYKISLTTNRTWNIHLGNTFVSTDGNKTKLIYMMIEGLPNVFAIKDEQVSYKDYTPVDLLDPLVFSRIISCVDTIVYKDANNSHTLKIKEPNFYIDEKSANEEKFRDMYNKIISPTILGEVNGNIGTEMCSFEFNYNTGTPSETLVFYEYGELYAAAKVNGRVEFYVKRSGVNDMMNAINKLAE